MLLLVFICSVTACYSNPIEQTFKDGSPTANLSLQMNTSDITIMCGEGTRVKILNAALLSETPENLNTTNRTISAEDSARDLCENKMCFVMDLDDTEIGDCSNETCNPWKVLINYECIPHVHKHAQTSPGKLKCGLKMVIFRSGIRVYNDRTVDGYLAHIESKTVLV